MTYTIIAVVLFLGGVATLGLVINRINRTSELESDQSSDCPYKIEPPEFVDSGEATSRYTNQD
ncbi:hypothetical protein [Ralstonia phage RP13]|nr:hypothetical protein [Ralstonia phage RP13]